MEQKKIDYSEPQKCQMCGKAFNNGLGMDRIIVHSRPVIEVSRILELTDDGVEGSTKGEGADFRCKTLMCTDCSKKYRDEFMKWTMDMPVLVRQEDNIPFVKIIKVKDKE